MDYISARHNMLNNQIIPWDVFDPKVRNLFGTTPREAFVPSNYKNVAYADTALPLGNGHHMLPPREQARLLQSVKIAPSDRVLEIGTGSGYLTSMLAKLAHTVVTVDIDSAFQQGAKEHLAQLNLTNITFKEGDGAHGWSQDGQFDVIILLGSVEKLPETYPTQLNVGGRLFAIIGNGPAMEATLLTRLSQDAWRTDILFETVAPRLVHGELPAKFVF